MYSGVPLMLVSTMVLLDIARAKPKSHSFTVPPEPMRMFCSEAHKAAKCQMGLILVRKC